MMWWTVSPFAADEELDADTLKLGLHAPESYRGDTARALADTKGWLADGWRTVYVTEDTARPPAPWRCSAARASPPASTTTWTS